MMTYSKAEKSRRRRGSGSGSGSGSGFRLFKCFRSTVNDDEASQRLIVQEEDCAFLPKMAPLPPLPPMQAADKKARRGLAAGIKAVFFETSLGGKSRKSKRSRQSDGSSKGELSSTAASECSDSRMIDSSFSTSSLSLDSSLCSSLSSSSRSYDYGQNQKPSQSISLEPSQKKRSLKEKRSWSGYGLFALCITILVVVLWGKICAILCTSTWLYVTSQRSIAYTPENNVCDPTDSAEYKKRIVLGGFLDRNRSQFVACP